MPDSRWPLTLGQDVHSEVGGLFAGGHPQFLVFFVHAIDRDVQSGRRYESPIFKFHSLFRLREIFHHGIACRKLFTVF